MEVSVDRFKGNTSFAVINVGNTWRTDLTIRFCEYYSSLFNDKSFKEKISFAASIDEALQKCMTEFLVIQSPGSIIFSKNFFKKAQKFFEETKNFVFGNLELIDDYVIYHDNILIIDMFAWKNAGSPKYTSHLRTAPKFQVSEKTNNTYFPASIQKLDGDGDLITNFCSSRGAELIAAQLLFSGKITSAKSTITDEDFYFLSKVSPQEEILTETFFEKKILPIQKRKIFTSDTDNYPDIKNITTDVVVTTAQGLKAFNLLNYTGAKIVIIYDNNPLALEFQKRIFAVTEPTLFGDIISKFKRDYPKAEFDDSWEEEEFTLIEPLEIKEAKFVLMDVFTFEARDFPLLLDQRVSAVFDFSDIFTYPYNYYKRPLYQVQALFSEIFSILKSRLGPTFMLGMAPGFQNMNDVAVNTYKFEFEEVKLTVYEEETEKEITEYVLSNKMFAPQIGETLQEESVNMEWEGTAVNEDALSENIKELKQEAENLGYDIDMKKVTKNKNKFMIINLSKINQFSDFTGVYEYTFDSNSERWSFKVYKYGKDKKVEFANGVDCISLLAHLKLQFKINPKTAVKVL